MSIDTWLLHSHAVEKVLNLFCAILASDLLLVAIFDLGRAKLLRVIKTRTEAFAVRNADNSDTASHRGCRQVVPSSWNQFINGSHICPCFGSGPLARIEHGSRVL